jgi:hypothetical protein
VAEADLFGSARRSGLSQKKSVTSRLSNVGDKLRAGPARNLRKQGA